VGGETEGIDLRAKMEGLNLQTKVSPATDSAQSYLELTEYSKSCKSFTKLIGKPTTGATKI